VVARLERDLSEDGADPQGGDAQAPKVAELAPESLERAALPVAAGAEPRVVIDPAGVPGLVQRGAAAGHRAVLAAPVAAFFFAVGEAVQQQEVQDLVLPGRRGRSEGPPREGCEVEIQQTFLDWLGHRLTDPGACRRSPWRPPRCSHLCLPAASVAASSYS